MKNSRILSTCAGSRLSASAPSSCAAASAALGGAQPTVRIGYLGPDDRRAKTVAAIADSCKNAGITVQDTASGDFSPQALRDGKVDAVLAGPAGAAAAAGRCARREDPAGRVPGWFDRQGALGLGSPQLQARGGAGQGSRLSPTALKSRGRPSGRPNLLSARPPCAAAPRTPARTLRSSPGG
mgnify:CR=1 FL=1